MKKIILALAIAAASLSAKPTPTPTPTAEEYRVQKENALLRAKDVTPLRALAKMTELLAAGVQISKTTQDAVRQKALPSPTPTPGVPTPTPINDGL